LVALGALLALAVVVVGVLAVTGVIGGSGGGHKVPAEARAYCAVVGSLGDASRTLPDTGQQPAALAPQLTSTRSRFDAAAAKAPPAVAGDVRVFAGAYGQFVDSVAAVGYDASRLSPDKVMVLAAPEVQRALERMDAYDKQTCG
jgi:hypothetical protein